MSSHYVYVFGENGAPATIFYWLSPSFYGQNLVKVAAREKVNDTAYGLRCESHLRHNQAANSWANEANDIGLNLLGKYENRKTIPIY